MTNDNITFAENSPKETSEVFNKNYVDVVENTYGKQPSIISILSLNVKIEL